MGNSCGYIHTTCRAVGRRRTGHNKISPELQSANKIREKSESNGVVPLALSAFSLSTILDPEHLELPINEREVYVLMANWKTVETRLVEAGKLMFLRMFQLDPRIQDAFEKFRDMSTPTEIWRSTVLETHGMVVMNLMDEVITNLDDPQSVIQLVVEQGKAHVNFGDIAFELFWHAEEAFMMSIREILDDELPTHVKHVYRKVIHFVIKLLVTGYRIGLSNKKSNTGRQDHSDSERGLTVSGTLHPDK